MLVSEHRLCSISIFILILTQVGYNHIVSGTVTVDPPFACVGDRITVNCSLAVPAAGDIFSSLDANYIVGNSDTPINPAVVNSNIVSGGVDLAKLMAVSVFGNTTFVEGRLILLSYLSEDNNTRLGCGNEYRINGNSANRDTLRDTLNVIQAGPPTAVSLSVSLTSLLPATCSGVVRVAWTPGATDRPILSYSLSLNGDTLGTFSPSVTSHDSTLSVATDMVYRYSVTASSCAGSSIPSYGANISVQSYSLVNSPPLYLSYDMSTSMLSVDWGLVPGNEPLLLGYSLQLNYSHSQYGTTNEFANSTYFSLISGTSLYSVPLTPHSFPTADGVVTNITACIAIASQCGTAFIGDMLCGFFNSENPPTTTQPTTAPTIVEITRTPAIVTTEATQPPQPAEALPVAVIAGVVGGGAIVLFILIIVLVVVMLCICCAKKSKEHSSTVPKQPTHIYDEINEAPPAHYDYIEIDTLANKNTSTHKPPLVKLKPGDTHIYTHMNPVTSDQMVLQSPYENLAPS